MYSTFFSFWHFRNQWSVGANGTVGGAVGRVVALERSDSELEPTSTDNQTDGGSLAMERLELLLMRLSLRSLASLLSGGDYDGDKVVAD